MNPSGEQCYSGGLDSIISVWNMPSSEVDPYDAYGINFLELNFRTTDDFSRFECFI
jgi:hypothetical protein